MKIEKPKHNTYCATVVKINSIVELDNCDNVVAANIFGYQAIVGRDTKIGDIGLVFPAETQLSEKYCSENNLFRHGDLNKDQGKKGYIEDNRRVKAVRFRGNQSNCLFMPLESLEWTGINVDQLKVGDEFDYLNGEEICKKYVRKVRANRGNVQPKAKKFNRVDPQFMPEHFKTDHYFKFAPDLDPETDVIVSQKLHGCFRSNTNITMEDGSYKKITEIKKGDLVAGVNELGEIIPSKVKNTFINGKTDKWIKLKFDNISKGDKPTTYSTPDHLFYTENRGYVAAKDIDENDVCVISQEFAEITNMKKSILTGMLLGDGYLNNRTSKNWNITYSHKRDHEEYINYIKIMLGNLDTQKQRLYMSGYGSKILRGATYHHPEINKIFKDWKVINKRKEIPENIVLDKYSLAFWYMDDGSLSHHESQQDRANIAVCGLSDRSCDILKQALLEYGFRNPVFYKSNGYNRLRLNYKDAEILFNSISDLIPPIMQYKIPDHYREKYYLQDEFNKKTIYKYKTKMVSKEIVLAKKIGYLEKYDIETETNNFFAQKILVHNSSIRIAHTKVKRKLTLRDQIAKLIGAKVQETEYDYVYGSRRVVKDINNLDQNHYYLVDIWTIEGEKLKGLIPENYILYGELIGWTPEGAEIQRGYSYGIDQGSCELYLYRVAIINAGGVSQDLSWDHMVDFCKSIGAKVVPEIWRGKLKDLKIEDYMDKRLFDEGYLSCLALGNDGVVDEGVVVRVDRRTPYCMKAKSPLFLEHETRLMDQEVEDIEAEQEDDENS